MSLIQTIQQQEKKFPFLLITEEDNDLTLLIPNSISIKKNAEVLISTLACSGVIGNRIVIHGDYKQVAKFTTGPFSGLMCRCEKPEEFLEVWTFWSPKITIGGIFIAALDLSAPHPFIEYLINMQNFAQRKWASINFGNNFVSVKRCI